MAVGLKTSRQRRDDMCDVRNCPAESTITVTGVRLCDKHWAMYCTGKALCQAVKAQKK